MKSIYNFTVDYLAPAIGETLGLAFKALGKVIGGIIDLFADFVDKVSKIKDLIDAIKNAGSAVKNFISGASFETGASSPSTPTAPSMPIPAPSLPRYIAASTGTTNITVNGAIDSESTARQIVTILNDSSARGTLGGGLIYA
jgi:prophage DNA circulation protein